MHDKLSNAAKEVGAEDGKIAAGSIPWRMMKTHDARRIVTGWDSDDEEVLGLCPNPLAGEWADDPTPMALLDRIANKADPNDKQAGPALESDTDDLFTLYEEAYSEAFWDFVIPACKLAMEAVND